MSRSKKTYEERIAEVESKKQQHLESAKQYGEQARKLKSKQKDEERRLRTNRLIQIGAEAEAVLGRPFDLENNDVEKFRNFLLKQEDRGRYYSKAMSGDGKAAEDPVAGSITEK